MTPNEPSPPKPFLAMTRRGFWAWLFIIFMVSAWMFVLGILVGRGTAPVHFDLEKLQKELSALKQAVVDKELQKITSGSPTGLKSTDLGFYEKLKEPDTTDTPPAIVKKTTPQPGKPASETGSVQALPAEKVAPAATRPSAAQAEAGKGSFTIQVSAIKDEAAADQLVAKLRMKGYAAYWIKAEVPATGTWYRVRVGPYAQREAAEPVLQRLKSEKLSGFIVKQ